MLAIPDTLPVDMPPFASELSMPYTLTPGRAAGTFLAELPKRRIVGSRFKKSGIVVVPALDFCPETGDGDFEFVEAPQTATLTAYTETPVGLIGLVQFDGSAVTFAHLLLDVSYDDLAIGQRLTVRWAEGVEGMLAIAGFVVTPDAPAGVVGPIEALAAPIEVIPYRLSFHYQHAFGPYYGRLFDEIKNNRRIMGVRVSDGEGALLPPREYDDLTYRPTGTWVELSQTGTVRAMSVIHLAFEGQTRAPPYIYAEIMLDGASTRLIHTVAGFDMSRAKELVKPGSRVRAVWSDKRTGSLADISHFELIDE